MTKAIVIDGREMVPPQPLEHTMAALDDLDDDGEVLLLLYCQPHPLYTILRQNGYRWEEKPLDDGTFEIRIRKALPGA